MSSNKLEQAAITQRNLLIPKNYYNGISNTNTYSATHTRALSDNLTPVNGKGTGNYLDIENYNAGGLLDKEGNPSVAVGSGRLQALAMNLSTWGYGPGRYYQQPDTSLNTGQVVIGG